MSAPRHEPDDWADPPDRWAEDDRAWKEKWETRPPESSGDDVEPPPDSYRPKKASARSVADSYEEGMREAGPYLTFGIQIAGSMLFFVVVGWAIDNWAGTSPWGVLIGTVLGFVGVITLVVRLSNSAAQKKK